MDEVGISAYGINVAIRLFAENGLEACKEHGLSPFKKVAIRLFAENGLEYD